MNGSVTLPLTLRVVPDTAEMRIRATGDIPYSECWRQVDAEYDDVPTNNQDNSGENNVYSREYEH